MVQAPMEQRGAVMERWEVTLNDIEGLMLPEEQLRKQGPTTTR